MKLTWDDDEELHADRQARLDAVDERHRERCQMRGVHAAPYGVPLALILLLAALLVMVVLASVGVN